jgi:hypothetical protein
MNQSMNCGVGKANGSRERAPDGMPTTRRTLEGTVGTAQRAFAHATIRTKKSNRPDS